VNTSGEASISGKASSSKNGRGTLQEEEHHRRIGQKGDGGPLALSFFKSSPSQGQERIGEEDKEEEGKKKGENLPSEKKKTVR